MCPENDDNKKIKIEETAHEKDKETLTSGESKGVNKEDKRKREGKVLRVLLSGRWLPRNQG